MLSLKYVMAKSMELTSKLELGSVVASVRSGNADHASSASSVTGRDAESLAVGSQGEAFLREQSKDWDVVLVHHRKLLQSGEVLSDELARARKRLQDQVESEAYVTQHFHEIKRVREQLSTIRGLVEKIAEDVEDVEQYLMHRTEEYMAAQNAVFVTQQERELDLFEERILEEKEDRKKQLVAARREVLAEAFQKDLKTYQTLVAYQGPVVKQRTTPAPLEESLESVDLVVTTDAAQLEAFYDTEDDDDVSLRFAQDDEEEKSHEEDDALQKIDEKEEDVEEVSVEPAEPFVEEPQGPPKEEEGREEGLAKSS